MTMKQVFKQLPVYVIHNFYKRETEKDFQKNYDYIVQEFNKFLEVNESKIPMDRTFNFELENNEYTQKLYNKVFSYLKSKFKFSPTPYKENTIYAYLSNKTHNDGHLHNHEGASSLNAVYYFNVPEDIGGGLNFRLSSDGLGPAFIYKPKKYDLVIFPDAILHEPLKMMDSEEYRISLNFQIIANEPAIQLFSPFFNGVKIERKRWWQFWKKDKMPAIS